MRMFRKYILVFSLLTLVLANNPKSASSTELNINEVLELLDGSLQAVTSFDVRFEVRPWRWTSMLVNTGPPRETFLCHAHDVLFLLSSRHKPLLIF